MSEERWGEEMFQKIKCRKRKSVCGLTQNFSIFSASRLEAFYSNRSKKLNSSQQTPNGEEKNAKGSGTHDFLKDGLDVCSISDQNLI
jgi:hypothetical protein